MNSVNRPEAIVFDMDGVLFDSESMCMECWLYLAEKYGYAGMREAYIETIGTNRKGTWEIFSRIYGEEFPYLQLNAEAGELYRSRWIDGHPRMKEGTFELLNALQAAGIPTALATSTSREIVYPMLEGADIRRYFASVICGDMVTRGKPDPEIYLRSCETLKADPAVTYAIEDSYNGIRSAFAAGMRPLMVPDLIPATEEMQQKAEIVLPSLHAVREYLHL